MDTISTRFEATGGPKYRAVAGAIRSAIDDGDLVAGAKLPPVRDLAWTLGITPGTVARAYTILTDEGALIAEVGRGTFVAAPASEVQRVDAPWHQQLPAEETGLVSLFSPRLPDVGQVALIRDGFARLAAQPADGLLNYPSRQRFEPARRAVLRWLTGTPLGSIDESDIVLSHGGQNGISQ